MPPTDCRADDEHFHFGYAHFTPLLNLIKALLMVVLCVSALIMKKASKKSKSELVSVDAESWVVDTAISSAVMFGFLAGFLIQATDYDHLLPYLDPVIVTILSDVYPFEKATCVVLFIF